jgi:hypothetical protein
MLYLLFASSFLPPTLLPLHDSDILYSDTLGAKQENIPYSNTSSAITVNRILSPNLQHALSTSHRRRYDCSHCQRLPDRGDQCMYSDLRTTTTLRDRIRGIS